MNGFHISRFHYDNPNPGLPLQLFLAGLFAMTEKRLVHHGKFQDKWLMCPTCRQHTDVGNIAYADDRQTKSCDSAELYTVQSLEKSEASVIVQGSYGTKVCFLSTALYLLYML